MLDAWRRPASFMAMSTAALFDDLEAIKDETMRELENGISHIPMYPQQAAHIRAQRAAMLETFRAYETAVETAANQLLTRYRDRNREARTTPVAGVLQPPLDPSA